MPIRTQLTLTWIVGVPSLILSGEVDSRFGLGVALAGLSMVVAALRVALDRASWEDVDRSYGSRPWSMPGRRGFITVLGLIGLAWIVLGLSDVI